jgi:hypothetical protein
LRPTYGAERPPRPSSALTCRQATRSRSCYTSFTLQGNVYDERAKTNGTAISTPVGEERFQERMPTRQVSLKKLVSHHQQRYDDNGHSAGNDHDSNSNDNRGIDNTGNICVWDCEKTLAWVLLQEQQQQFSSGINMEIASSGTTTTTTTTTETTTTAAAATDTTAAGPRIVTELGAGMVGLAGLAGLCLVAAATNHNNGSNNSSSNNNGFNRGIQECT